MLISFYIFSHEKSFPEYNSSRQKLMELKAEYQKILQRLDELEQQRKSQGISQNQRETALRMLKRGKMTIEEIAEDTGLSIIEVEQLAGLQTV